MMVSYKLKPEINFAVAAVVVAGNVDDEEVVVGWGGVNLRDVVRLCDATRRKASRISYFKICTSRSLSVVID